MKRTLSLLLMGLLLLQLSGCGSSITDTALFYYQRSDYLYSSDNGAVAPEERNITSHRDDLSYLVSLYLMGPLDEDLQSPFPADCRLVNTEADGSTLCITLSDIGSISEAQFSLACGCLAMTCLDLTQADSVTICCGEQSETITRDNLTLFDSITTEASGG